eukprot:Phypoly_transcript_09815.p1 GENE.Phypoly_transcript_09815~~Phypoly_transcript_09815.p1  ORF type:complete len:418 (+),score=55.79 Phypoly_transcript_09815:107-1255(+)
MSFWADFKDQFKQQYNKNEQLKESVDEIKQTAERVGQTSTNLTNKAKGTLGSVSDRIKVAVPYSPDSTKIKKGAGKASEVLKKALDFLGNNLTFLKTESSIPQRSQQQQQQQQQQSHQSTKAEASTEGKATGSASTTTSSSDTKPGITEKPRGPPLMSKTSSSTQTIQTVPPLENPEEAPGGGTALTVVPTSEWEKYWQKIGGDAASVLGQKLNARVGSFMNRILPETTIASTISKIKETNNDFTLHSFLNELQEFVPLVMECLLLADVKGMKPLASEKMYRMFMDIVRSSTTRGTFQDSKLLDVGQIELWDAKIDENNRPSFIITFTIQFIYTIRDRAGKIIEGAEDDIKSSHYIMLITPDPSETTWVCHEVMQQSLSSYL